MKKNIFTVLDRLYLSLSVIVIGIILFVAFQDVSSELRNNERFERAHKNLEKVIPIDTGSLNKLTLTEARELVSLESYERNHATASSYDELFLFVSEKFKTFETLKSSFPIAKATKRKSKIIKKKVKSK